MIEDTLLYLVLFILLSLDLIAIATRASYSQLNLARLLGLREQMDITETRAFSFLPLLPRVKAGLSLILIMTRFLLASIILILLISNLNLEWYAVLTVMLLGSILLFWLEWALERVVSKNPEIWAVRLHVFVKFFVSPLSWLLVPARLPKQQELNGEATGLITERDLKSLVDAGEEEGVFEHEERRMIYSIFQLGNTLAREIMIPRIDILTLDVNTPLKEAVDALLQSGHSRVPVYEEVVDNTLGLLYAKDLLRVWREGEQVDSLRGLLRPAYFVPEAKKVDELLEEMQSQRIHIAIVVDEYGGIAGIVTLEDIVEEILGEIQDEYDQGEESPYQVTEDGEYLFQGRIDLDDFNEIMASSLPTTEADTLGGFIYSRLGHVPMAGEAVQSDGLMLTVEQVAARRIRKVRASREIEKEILDNGE